MGFLRAIQTIADDQTEVASKLQTLLDEYDVRDEEIDNINFQPYGANKFVILVVYELSVERVLFKLAYGLKTAVLRKVLTARRKLLPLMGLKPTISRLIKLKLVIKAASGIKSAVRFGIRKLPISVRMGLKSSITRGIFNANGRLNTQVGLKLGYAAKYKGIPIIWP